MSSSSSAASLLPGANSPRAWNLVDLLDSAGPAVSLFPESYAARLAAEQAERALLEAAAAEEAARGEEQAEWERRLAEARREGFEAGREEGEIMEQARLRGAVRAAEDALEELRLGESRWTGTIEENVCALAVAIARQVIGRELEQDIEPVLDLVRSAFTEFPIDQPMRVRVNPNDLNAISRESADGESPMMALTRNRDARWIADASIVAGGCIVEGRERIIDGRVDLALERIYRRLTYTHA